MSWCLRLQGGIYKDGYLNSQKTSSWGWTEVGKDLISGSFSVCLTAKLMDLVCCSCEITLVPGLGDSFVHLRKGEVKTGKNL